MQLVVLVEAGCVGVCVGTEASAVFEQRVINELDM
jgi:hypothetical protein